MSEPILGIPLADIKSFSKEVQAELMAYYRLRIGVDVEPHATATSNAVSVEDNVLEGPADLTVAFARKLIAEPIHPKTLAVLRAIAASPSPVFQFADALAAAPNATTYRDIRGTWSGITRRTRNILNDPDADLIWWEGEPVYSDDGTYIDQQGRVSQLTHQSLQTALGIR
ncbi:hypothetical protein [Novosphingobium mathurense]|uniref:Uncharacterized protein n=1 Tax=Novosphingobium mathurense TaxID=428990 RepID=A0A1U6IHJ2_9SPHN|nr:hypothetical protein [Novosphingobium mathurense]SLK07484.1 hypothetical protein SAMN06295987_106259 [Novosphingobium mathurense]